jgi:hypothetical protein
MSASSEQTTLYPEDGGSRFLKTLGTPLPMVQQCQKALNDISTQQVVGL